MKLDSSIEYLYGEGHSQRLDVLFAQLRAIHLSSQ